MCLCQFTHLTCSADGDSDDLDNTNKSFQEGAFATLYTLTKSRQLDASVRLAVLKVVLEFLQASNVHLHALHTNCSQPTAFQTAAKDSIGINRNKQVLKPKLLSLVGSLNVFESAALLRCCCLQLFRVLFSTSFPWVIHRDLW
jgi:hypothetical protein